jgi:predicted enzyme related to lactoylglutathione lyase
MAEHPIVHIEIPANNLQAAGQFYADLFGWKTEDIPEMSYVTYQAPPGPGGGFTPVGGPMGVKAGEVLIYVGTDDIEASLAKAESLGGQRVVPKTEIPGMGWFAVFTDPTGNRVGLFANGGQQG